jgi:hypothetical protein
MPFHVRFIAVCTVIWNMMTATGDLMATTLQPAHYKQGKTVFVTSVKVDGKGGVIEIRNTGTPIDNTTIDIPQGTFEQEVTLSVGYDNGTLQLRSGRGSGIVMILTITPEHTLQKPLTVTVVFDPVLKPETIVGYQIDNKGFLHALDIKSIDKVKGAVSFCTFQALMFTWVYVY